MTTLDYGYCEQSATKRGNLLNESHKRYSDSIYEIASVALWGSLAMTTLDYGSFRSATQRGNLLSGSYNYVWNSPHEIASVAFQAPSQ